MKFNYSLIFFISSLIAQSHKEKSEETVCYTNFECKLQETFKQIRTKENFLKCAEFVDDQKALFICICKLSGLNDTQANTLMKLIPAYEGCGPSVLPQFDECIGKCSSDNASCKETCADGRDDKSTECFAKQLGIKDFDAKKATQCSKKCTMDNLADIFDCDRKCKEPIYKKFESGTQDSKSGNSTDTKSSTTTSSSSETQTSSQDAKPTSGSSTASTQKSSGFSNLPASLFSVISVPILLSLLL